MQYYIRTVQMAPDPIPFSPCMLRMSRLFQRLVESTLRSRHVLPFDSGNAPGRFRLVNSTEMSKSANLASTAAAWTREKNEIRVFIILHRPMPL